MSVAVYLRTSTDEQDGAAQRHALAPVIDAGARVYEDRGVSGARVSRPAWDALRADVRAGRVREVHAYALDRFGRSSAAVILALEEFAAAGVRVRTVREGHSIDPSTPVGAALVGMLATFAQLERSLIRERVTAGVKRAREKGTRSGRAIGRPRREVDADEVHRRRAAGESWRVIAQAMRVPVRTLRRVGGSK